MWLFALRGAVVSVGKVLSFPVNAPQFIGPVKLRAGPMRISGQNVQTACGNGSDLSEQQITNWKTGLADDCMVGSSSREVDIALPYSSL